MLKYYPRVTSYAWFKSHYIEMNIRKVKKIFPGKLWARNVKKIISISILLFGHINYSQIYLSFNTLPVEKYVHIFITKRQEMGMDHGTY